MIGNKKQLLIYLAKLEDEDKKYEIKEYREKRSLDANGYLWVICEKIAQELSKDGKIMTKEDIYKDAILNVGAFTPLIIEEKAFESFKKSFESQGLGNQVQETARKNKCVRCNCYYGSSTYNTKEMSRLIDLIVQEAQQLDIETKSPEELKSMLGE